MLSSLFVYGAFLLDLACAHGRLTIPTTRLGNPDLYENDPVRYPVKEFVCRNDKNPAVTAPTYTAGDVIQIEYLTSAPHNGDAAVYISYDGDELFATRETMQFFKIANIPNAKASSATPVSITLPPWLPSGAAVLRWEWYALHVNPTIELYAQCADIVIEGSADEVPLGSVPKYHVVDQTTYDPTTLPKQNQGDIWGQQATLYRNAFDTDNYVQFMTGPECAFDYTLNHCGETAVGTIGWIDMGLGSTSAPTTQSPVTPAPPTTQSPVTPAPPTTQSPVTPAPPTTQSPVTPAPPTTQLPVTPAPPTTQSPVTPAPPTTQSPVSTSTAPASTLAPGQCSGTTLWQGSQCTADTAACCPSGTTCYEVNAHYSGCLPECQAGWICSQPAGHPCPTRFSGAQCDGVNFTGGNVGCCAYGYTCYKYNDWWSGCFQGACPAGYECD